MVKITFLKQHKVYSVKEGMELLQAYKIDPTLPLRFGCCNAECGVCVIKIKEGQESLSKMTGKERITLKQKKLDKAYRLACQCAVHGDIVIE